jgi:hypothetical protein
MIKMRVRDQYGINLANVKIKRVQTAQHTDALTLFHTAINQNLSLGSF